MHSAPKLKCGSRRKRRSHHRADAAPKQPPGQIDWREVAANACLDFDWAGFGRIVLGSDPLANTFGVALRMLGNALAGELEAEGRPRTPWPKAKPTENPNPSKPPHVAREGSKVLDAAALLGVSIDASEDEIRAALRSRLASSRLHPDHGGDGEEAKRLIAAKNLLCERARARVSA